MIKNTTKNVDIISYAIHRMSLDTLVGQFKRPIYRNPLEIFTVEILIRFMMFQRSIIGRLEQFFAVGTLSDNNIVMSTKAVWHARIVLVY